MNNVLPEWVDRRILLNGRVDSDSVSVRRAKSLRETELGDLNLEPSGGRRATSASKEKKKHQQHIWQMVDDK
ncbi:hypothetical protein EYF80_036386 [Liparis tanakae]|uniref:Uncharacterized protein n=1 Tax=Liparis tanakae TaxID=230148 RepID=A0A4Z2GJD9_9TELE|nr:hypothetical protein EYF80_036386 [Liparis tanakae]